MKKKSEGEGEKQREVKKIWKENEIVKGKRKEKELVKEEKRIKGDE